MGVSCWVPDRRCWAIGGLQAAFGDHVASLSRFRALERDSAGIFLDI